MNVGGPVLESVADKLVDYFRRDSAAACLKGAEVCFDGFNLGSNINFFFFFFLCGSLPVLRLGTLPITLRPSWLLRCGFVFRRGLFHPWGFCLLWLFRWFFFHIAIIPIIFRACFNRAARRSTEKGRG